MKKVYFKIGKITSLLLGEGSDKLIISVHGNMSNKEDGAIIAVANEAIKKGYQVLSFDLPDHGARKNNGVLCKVQNCIEELQEILTFARTVARDISLFACSIGAYFSLQAYSGQEFEKCLFLSPVVDMRATIENIMRSFNINVEQLRQQKKILTPIGITLYNDYYEFVLNNPIVKWGNPTKILCGQKDNTIALSSVEAFAHKFDCNLDILENGEHYFHTIKQLNSLRVWIENSL